MPLAGVDDRQPRGASSGEHPRGRLEAGPGQIEVIAHRIDVAAGAAEVDLPVDEDQGGVGRAELAVVGPGIGLGVNRAERSVLR